MGRAKRIWYLSPMRAAKVQASLRLRAVSPEPPLLAHTSSESRGTFRRKARSLVLLNGWACAAKICHDGMLEDTNSLDSAQVRIPPISLNNFLFALQNKLGRILQASKDDKKAMIRNRYNRIPHAALNTKRERDTYN